MKETIRILNLAVAKIVSSRDLGCYGIIASDFWAESLFNGLFMQELAKATGENDPEEAYTAGLLRFIGRLAINQTIENLHSGIFWDGSESLTDWEVDKRRAAPERGGSHTPGHLELSRADHPGDRRPE
jgi:hypothetical protein